jgi:hypothetical protein
MMKLYSRVVRLVTVLLVFLARGLTVHPDEQSLTSDSDRTSSGIKPIVTAAPVEMQYNTARL